MRRRAGLAVVGVAVALAGAACSSDRSTSTSTTTAATASATATHATLTVVSQNILHGISCPTASNRCELPSRVSLFVRQLADAHCPEIVGMQETNSSVTDELKPALRSACDGKYRIVTDKDPGLDREIVLTTDHVVGSRRLHLAGPLRTALHVRLATAAGLVDFVTTHLAASSDDRPCDLETCPPPCLAGDMLNACQARQVIAAAKALESDGSLVVVAGDLNAKVDEPTNQAFRDAGFVDTHTEIGNHECDPATGKECTSGRVDTDLSDLRNPRSRQTERIDFAYIGGARAGECKLSKPTGLFNATGATSGPKGLAFPSDHTGVEATIGCPVDEAHRRSASTATMPASETTTTIPGGPVDAATTAAVTTAFEDVFSGSVTDIDRKLSSLQDGLLLRDTFIQSYEATKAVNSRISVRIDALTMTDARHVAVIYTLLLDGSTPVLDHLPGEAFNLNGRWLVTKRTYCNVSTTGASTIPQLCQ